MENQKIQALQNIFSSRLDTLSHFLTLAESHFGLKTISSSDSLQQAHRKYIVEAIAP
jgi:hypothetical protein